MGSALPIVGGVLGLYQAGRSASAQKQAAGAQKQIARNQTELFRQTTPLYNAALQHLFGQAGLSLPGAATPASGQPTVPPTGQTPLPTGSGALPDSSLGIFGQNPEDRLRFQAAEEDIGRYRDVREDQLRFALGRQGAGQATISAALARNESDAQQQLASFRRNLAIQARAEQERRIGALLQALAPGLGAGPAAAGIFGNQANMYAGQASAAGQGIGSLLSNYLLAAALRRGGGATPGIAGGYGPGVIAGPIDPNDPLMAALMGRLT